MSGTTSRRYPPGLKQRAVRVVGKIRGDHESDWTAICQVAEPLGVGMASVRGDHVDGLMQVPVGGRDADASRITNLDRPMSTPSCLRLWPVSV